VPFVQVTDFRLETERAEQPPSADPEEQFLLEAQIRPAPVEFAGNPPINWEVRRETRQNRVLRSLPDYFLRLLHTWIPGPELCA
jgi:hypothetical protein